jgi:hypothetical protein
MRFAIFEIKVCILNLISNFKLLPTAKTDKNAKSDPRNVLGAAKDGLWIKFEDR